MTILAPRWRWGSQTGASARARTRIFLSQPRAAYRVVTWGQIACIQADSLFVPSASFNFFLIFVFQGDSIYNFFSVLEHANKIIISIYLKKKLNLTDL